MPKIVLLLLFLIVSCTANTKETTEGEAENTETVEGEADETDLIVDDLADSTQMEDESPGADDEELGALKTYTLKWKEVNYDEYGIMYTFENRNGEEIIFTQISIPDFNGDDYYTSTAVEDRIFPLVEIKDDIKEKWFEVVTEIQEMENVNEPTEPYNAPVIISIKPL